MGRIKDITGERFGKLVAVKNVGVNKHKRALWLCKCDCGNECVVTSQELNKGEECDGFMVAHHLENYKNNEDLRLDTNNGVCLCEQCHKEFHKWMGGNKIECTKEDYITFKDAMNTKQVE